jgi:hypothetical protein
MNVRNVAKQEIESWVAENPRKAGENVRQYRRRAQQQVGDKLKSEHAGSPWLTILMQLLPLLIEWFINRKS